MTQLFRNSDPHTSTDAAISIETAIARQEAMIYSALYHFGPMNAEGIAEIICEQFRWKPDSVAVCRRLSGMENRLIEYAGYTLPNSNGRRARAMRVIATQDKAA